MPVLDIPLTSDQRRIYEWALFDPDAREICAMGSRGTAKTFVGCNAAVGYLLKNHGEYGFIVRKTDKAARENIEQDMDTAIRAHGIKVRVNKTEGKYYFPNGSQFHIRHCANEQDYRKIQGVQYAFGWFEECTQHSRSAYMLLSGSMRARKPGRKVVRLLTGNFGEVHDKWIIERYVNDLTRPPGAKYIHGILFDSLPTLERNPGYYDEILSGLPEWKQQQWVWGRHDVVVGSYFDTPPGLIKEQGIPPWAKWYAGIDWAYGNDAYAVVWGAKWQDTNPPYDHLHIGMDLKGWKWLPDIQARHTLEKERKAWDDGYITSPVRIRYGSWDAWKRVQAESQSNYDSINLMWRRNGLVVQKAKRTMRVPGWQIIKTMIAHGVLTIDPKCHWLIDELRFAVQEGAPDQITGEDIDDSCDMDALDALRYLVISQFGLEFRPRTADPYERYDKTRVRWTKERK